MTDRLAELCAITGLDLEDGVRAQGLLQRYEELVRKWNPTINVIAKSTLSSIWQRHILDSAQLFRFVPREGLWLDLGSGGGFPAIVLACLAAIARPEAKILMVEADQRKGVFLRECCRQLQVSADVYSGRIETMPRKLADVVSARALAPLVDLLEMAYPNMASDGSCVFLKGEKSEDEVTVAKNHWHFDLTATPSATSDGASILEIRRLRHV